MSCPLECDWCGGPISGGPRRHALCKEIAKRQQNTPVRLLKLVERESLNEAFKLWKLGEKRLPGWYD
ncbi:MAG TPA: hypothetical protein VI653_00640 [Steroidobacteraceae bacterium]